MRTKFAYWLLRAGYRLLPPRNTAGVVVRDAGTWQAIKL